MRERETAVARARELRERQTDAEGRLWRHLRGRRFGGVKFRRQYPVGPFIVDFCCPSEALVIELDGGQHDAARGADAARTAYLNELGYRVLRFWNSGVVSNEEAVLSSVASALGIDWRT